MTVIHAYRRREGATVELYGLSIEFKPNAAQDVVAEVEPGQALERLLSIPEAYCLYGQAAAEGAAQPVPGATAQPADMRSFYVFCNEAGEAIDLTQWTGRQIRDFAERNGVELPRGSAVKVDELRDLLAAALRAGAEE